ncbi:hypothetical protein EMIHUDRAFT_241994 [Emiliania huxleyi CCMP1516]|uniref:Uncharacterized protein n=2 Tax=Emiliania huxleyi TaxID=2903 RepID=A0A0D3JAU6_EMIH1|nr:hypothetical protein EMIHUDRAFT_241994 [Emiliania huxleyi CCMP1516]EOD20631.1 hypothetical protein EMIHUDRAFT_241994 [Emiliania huxleyi CCMP1516]|eukprot:XP_005773060.1 hypothetical protein EMIHUDRAFT_241994 [Emiliania huxleyi CCMP1516]
MKAGISQWYRVGPPDAGALRACYVKTRWDSDATSAPRPWKLPHAHVTPDEALGCLRFGYERERGAAVPAIAVVQLPCCGYVWHGTALGQPPDVERLDGRICAATRTVREWRDVSAHFNFGASARGLGARTAGG